MRGRQTAQRALAAQFRGTIRNRSSMPRHCAWRRHAGARQRSTLLPDRGDGISRLVRPLSAREGRYSGRRRNRAVIAPCRLRSAALAGATLVRMPPPRNPAASTRFSNPSVRAGPSAGRQSASTHCATAQELGCERRAPGCSTRGRSGFRASGNRLTWDVVSTAEAPWGLQAMVESLRLAEAANRPTATSVCFLWPGRASQRCSPARFTAKTSGQRRRNHE